MISRPPLKPQQRRLYDDGPNTVNSKKLSKPRSTRGAKPSSGKSEACASTDATLKKQDKPARSKRSPSSKAVKLSERWTVLAKIIRVQKAINDAECNNLNDVNEDEEDQVISIHSSSEGSSQCQSRGIYRQHAHSPKIPSPLTGLPSAVLYPDPLRYQYLNHGMSQASLRNKRTFWSRRRHEWNEYECHLEAWRAVACAQAAYGGILDSDVPQHPPQLPMPYLRGRTDSASESPLSKNCSSPMPAQVENARSIATYPRVGDISTLRDPFLLSVDSWFCDLPLWTLAKLGWLYDINHRLYCSTPLIPLRSRMKESFLQEAPEDISVDQDCLPDVSVCSNETTSSDVTLVNIALNEKQLRSLTEEQDGSPQETVYWTPVLSAPSEDSHQRMDAVSEVSVFPRAWEVSWYSRWEVLYHQLRLASSIASGSDFQESPSLDLIKEASKILLTSGRVLYNPDAEHYAEYESENSSGGSSREVEANSDEEPEEAFQELQISDGNSWSRRANIDPLVMFAMAQVPLSENSTICDTEDCSKGAEAFPSDENDLVHSLERMSLHC